MVLNMRRNLSSATLSYYFPSSLQNVHRATMVLLRGYYLSKVCENESELSRLFFQKKSFVTPQNILYEIFEVVNRIS